MSRSNNNGSNGSNGNNGNNGRSNNNSSATTAAAFRQRRHLRFVLFAVLLSLLVGVGLGGAIFGAMSFCNVNYDVLDDHHVVVPSDVDVRDVDAADVEMLGGEGDDAPDDAAFTDDGADARWLPRHACRLHPPGSGCWSLAEDADAYAGAHSYVARTRDVVGSNLAEISWTVIAGPDGGVLGFAAFASVYSPRDVLEFSVDDVLKVVMTVPSVDWEQHYVGIGPGKHTVKWRLVKDLLGSSSNHTNDLVLPDGYQGYAKIDAITYVDRQVHASTTEAAELSPATATTTSPAVIVAPLATAAAPLAATLITSEAPLITSEVPEAATVEVLATTETPTATEPPPPHVEAKATTTDAAFAIESNSVHTGIDGEIEIAPFVIESHSVHTGVDGEIETESTIASEVPEAATVEVPMTTEASTATEPPPPHVEAKATTTNAAFAIESHSLHTGIDGEIEIATFAIESHSVHTGIYGDIETESPLKEIALEPFGLKLFLDSADANYDEETFKRITGEHLMHSFRAHGYVAEGVQLAVLGHERRLSSENNPAVAADPISLNDVWQYPVYKLMLGGVLQFLTDDAKKAPSEVNTNVIVEESFSAERSTSYVELLQESGIGVDKAIFVAPDSQPEALDHAVIAFVIITLALVLLFEAARRQVGLFVSHLSLHFSHLS